VYYRALTEPTTFAIGLDASPDALVRGAWRAHRKRLANAAFLVESVERLPSELAGTAHEVAVHFPWGSLLRGLLTPDRAVLAPLAMLLNDGGEIQVLLSATERDGLPEASPRLLEAQADGFGRCGLQLVETRWASTADVSRVRSSWAKRLQVGRARPAVLARYRRRQPQG
jgi:16S rRNA (adenine(1408)-N(1))-methyltransferase